MDISNPPIFDNIKASSGEQLKCKVIEIGDWNMDTVQQVSVAHGMSDYTKIRSIQVWVRKDSGISTDVMYQLDMDAIGTPWGYVRIYDATNLYLWRTNGLGFDNADFNETSYNRGWVFIWYEE